MSEHPQAVRARVNSNTSHAYTSLKRKHDEVFKLIDSAITYEEKCNFIESKEAYEKGLKLIDKALKIDVSQFKEQELQKALKFQENLRKTHHDAKERLVSLIRDMRPPAPPRPVLPTYSEACAVNDQASSSLSPRNQNVSAEEGNSNSQVGRNFSYSEINSALDDILNESVSSEASAPAPQEVYDVLFSANDVQIYFISPSGYVSAPSYPSALRILDTSEHTSEKNTSSAVLQVGSWTYPLLPSQSPLLKENNGCYILPDLQSQELGSAVGLLLPSSLSSSEIRKFEGLIDKYSMVQVSETPQSTQNIERSKSTSEKIANNLVLGGELISWGLQKGAVQATKLLKYGGSKIKNRIIPENKPANIDPRVQKGMEIASATSNVAVITTGLIVSKIGEATMALGRMAAPHVEKYGNELFGKATGHNIKKSDKTVSNVMEVTAGGLKGLAAVYIGLEDAAKILAESLKNETVDIVGQKYGNEAAGVASDSLNSAMNVALAARNMSALAPKGLAKQLVKDTGKAVVQDYKTSKQKL